MAQELTSGTLISNIESQLADNNAGNISAADVRTNIANTARSINSIVASGDTNNRYAFTQDVRAQVQDPGGSPTGGTFIAESGILFPNAPVNSGMRQVQPYPGAFGINHNQLSNLTTGDVHTQYVSISGVKSNRVMTGNFPLGNNWINASGGSNKGIKFAPNSYGTEDVLVSGDLRFGGGSRIVDGNGVARAWLYFDASGVGNVPVVYGSYGINKLERLDQGKLRITFNSGLFADNNYVALGNSNGRTTASSLEDFDRNTVGLVARSGNDGSSLRSITFVILNEQGNYVDGQSNNFVAYGRNPNAASGNPIIVGI